jgi:hypothetical protein
MVYSKSKVGIKGKEKKGKKQNKRRDQLEKAATSNYQTWEPFAFDVGIIFSPSCFLRYM